MNQNVILYLHGGSKNHGCEAIIRSTAKLLQDLDVDIEVMSCDVAQDQLYHLDDDVRLKSAKSQYSYFSWDFLYAFVCNKLFGKYLFLDLLPYQKMITHSKHAKIAISIGGDNYCYGDVEFHTLLHKRIVCQNVKTLLFGCSIEPKLLDSPDIIKGLQKFGAIFTRESITYEAMQNHGLRPYLFPDPAFVLPSQECPDSRRIEEKDTIGINISPLILSYSNSNLIMDNYRALLEDIISNTTYRIALIPHVVWDNNDDRSVLNLLYEEFKSSNRLMLIEDHNCMELKAIISKCRFLVCARTHASIAAYSSCVPTLVIGYSVKARGIAKDIFGTEEHYVVNVQDLKKRADMVLAFNWIMDNEASIRTHLHSFIPEYISQLSKVPAIIKSFL